MPCPLVMASSTCFHAPVAIRTTNNRLFSNISKHDNSCCLRNPQSSAIAKPELPSKAELPGTSAGCPAHQSSTSNPAPSRTKRSHLPEGVVATNYQVFPDGFPIDNDSPSPPVHATIPFVGYFLDWIRGILPRDLARKYGEIYTTNGIMLRMHCISDWNAINELVPDVDTFRSRNSVPVIPEFFGQSHPINLDGTKHKTFRTNIAAGFSAEILPFYAERVRHTVEDAWIKMSIKTRIEGKQGKLRDMTQELYLGLMVEFANGIKLTDDEKKEMLPKMRAINEGFIYPEFTPKYKKALKFKNELQDKSEAYIRHMLVADAEIINELRKYGDDALKEGRKGIIGRKICIMHIWCAMLPVIVGPRANIDNDPEDIREIARMAFLLWHTGTATMGVTASWALMEMGFDDTIWNRLVEEQDSILKKTPGDDRSVKYDQIGEMKLLDSYLKEMLRVYPAIPFVVRKVANDFEVFGKRVEKGATVRFDFIAANMDERYYPEPEKIMVDRFLKGAPPVLTFGAKRSPHHCIGEGMSKMMMKTTLATVLRGYTMDLDKTQSRANKTIPVPDAGPPSGVLVNALTPLT